MENRDTAHVRYYYLRDEDHNPFGCVCLIREDDNKFHRGVSLCNFLKGDKFSKKIARQIAFSRATAAQKEYQERNISVTSDTDILGLSTYLDSKFNYILEKYGIGILPAVEFKQLPIALPKYHSDVHLSNGEREMWKDFLDPNFVH